MAGKLLQNMLSYFDQCRTAEMWNLKNRISFVYQPIWIFKKNKW